MEIRKAQRKKAKLRLGIAAPSGAGKTFSSLLLAFGLGGKIGLIDTEHGSGDLYAHLGDYDIIAIEAPYTVAKYMQAIKAFEDAGYATIIIDSLSHAWAGDGGLLDKQGKIADRGVNSFAAWRTITPEHNQLVDAMLQSPCHIIATMRAKQDYVLEVNDKGKQMPKKIGLAPVQREGMEYEFTVMLDVDMKHIASASKDRTSLFDGQYFTIDRKTGEILREWLEIGEDVPRQPKAKVNEPVPTSAPIHPSTGTWESMTADQQIQLMNIVDCVRSELNLKGAGAAAKLWAEETADLSAEEKTAAWTRLESDERSAMKKAQRAAQQAQEPVTTYG